MSKGLDTAPYKGVRDFYPGDMHLEKYIFSVWRKTVESFGYDEYSASPLEPAELYREKSGEEIVDNQTYTFTDRGDREVTLRPEMTPTLARMVAAKRRDLGFPLRWYSIPNLFRYENPQRGRLREHFQLNFDIFGIKELDAEVEILTIASKILTNFGAKKDDFVILINSRKLLNEFFASFDINDARKLILSKIIDKKDKIDRGSYKDSLTKVLEDQTDEFISHMELPQKILTRLGDESVNVKKIVDLITKLEKRGVTNVVFTPSLVRGFDYYTDIVFEIFDTDKDNRRSIFGGGRYDGLTGIFSAEDISAVGIATGDVVTADFLETHKLLPKYKSETSVLLASLEEKNVEETLLVADKLREKGVNISTDTTDRKISDKIKTALKHSIPYFMVIGDEETVNKIYKVKNLATEEEKALPLEEIPQNVI